MMKLPQINWLEVSVGVVLSCLSACLPSHAVATDCEVPCRALKKEPLGCVVLRDALRYEASKQWKGAEREFARARDVGGPCARKAASEGIGRVQPHLNTETPNFEFELATVYFNNGWWTEAEKHYAAAGKEGTEEQRKQILSSIQTARHNEVSRKLALGDVYFNNGWWKEAEKQYAAAAAEGTEVQRKDALAKAESAHQKDASYELDLGNMYFAMGWWREAEKHYVAGAREGSDAQRKAALANIEKVRGKCVSGTCNFDLALGDHYLKENAWKEAEVYYVAALKDGTVQERGLALTGIEKAREGSWRGSWAGGWGEWFEDAREKSGRLASIPGVLAGLILIGVWWYLYYLSRGIIDIGAYEVSQGNEAGRPLAFAFAAARDRLRSMTHGPAVFLPGLDVGLPETVEVAELKLPLGLVARFVKKPRVRIQAGWRVGTAQGNAQARISRRTRGLRYRQVLTVHRNDVPSAAGDMQDRKLFRFAVDVLVKAARV